MNLRFFNKIFIIILCMLTYKTNVEESRGNISTMTKNYKVSLSSVLSYHIPVQGQRSMKTKRAHHGDAN